MVHKILKIITIFLFLLFPLHSVLSAEPLNVVINEIAWMGTTVSYNDEWIELYNNTENAINLEDWGLYEQGGEILIEPLTGTIKAGSYYLIERTDETTVPDIEANQPPTSWGGNGLNNNGEHLQLLDNNSNIIDEVDCKQGWFAGKGKPEYKTMERINPLISGDDTQNWKSSQNPGGTPKAENPVGEPSALYGASSKQIAENKEQKTEEVTETGSLLTLPTIYPAGIVFNEILSSPEGSDAEEEWIEIFNQNNFEVNLSAWKIKDKEGKTTTFVFPEGTKISPLSYLVLLRPETKITLNNSNDGLELINPNGEIVNLVTFEKAALGQSYNKTQSGWVWSTVLTPEKENIIPLPPSKEKLAEVGPRAKEKTETGSLPISQETAAIGEKIPQPKLSKSPAHLYVLLIALAMAIFSAIVILILKKILTPKSSV